MSRLRGYLLRRAAWALALALTVVTFLGQGIELLDRSGAIRQAEVSPWTWTLQRLPFLLGLLIPVGTGVGAALYSGLLLRRGEWQTLQGLGLSARRLLTIPLPLVLLLILLQALSLEIGRPRAVAGLDSLQSPSKPQLMRQPPGHLKQERLQQALVWSPPGRGPVVVLLRDPEDGGGWGELTVLPADDAGRLLAYAHGEGLRPSAGRWTLRRLDVVPLQGTFPPLDALLPPPDELSFRLQGSLAGLPSLELVSLMERLPSGDALELSCRRALTRRVLELLLTPVCWWLCAEVGLAGQKHGRLDSLLARVLVTLAMALGLVYGLM